MNRQSPKQIFRHFYIFKPLLLGLLIAQVLSTMSVYRSNAELVQMVDAVTRAGYLSVPNQNIAQELGTFSAAFFGGLFFTLTIGACLSLSAFAIAWIWDRLLKRRDILLLPVLAIWVGCIGSVNSEGLCRIATAYFLLIPIVVFATTLYWLPEQRDEKMGLKIVVHLIILIILAAVASSQLNSNFFVRIRDNLLLSNPVGRKISNLYYDYTLHAARVFKSQDQRLIRTCSLAFTDDATLQQQLETALLDNDYLVLDRGEPTDLDIIRVGDQLDFKIRIWTIIQTTPKEFLEYPREILRGFSEQSDKYVFFRWFTFLSLFMVSGIVLYLSVYAVFRIICGFFMDSTPASVAAGMLCLVAGLALLVPLYFGSEKYADAGTLAQGLSSENWRERVIALRYVAERRTDISSLPGHTRMLESPHIPERYWLAKALRFSRSREAYRELLMLMHDPSFNVAYSAIQALGQRGDRRAVAEILPLLEVSDNWYVQWYAYRAIRKLGWCQGK